MAHGVPTTTPSRGPARARAPAPGNNGRVTPTPGGAAPDGPGNGLDWSLDEGQFFDESPTHVQPPPRRVGLSPIPSMLRGVARLSRQVPAGVLFLPARWPLRHALWWLGTVSGMGLVTVAAALACYLVAKFSPGDQLGLQALGVTLVASVSGLISFVLIVWLEAARRRWQLFRLEGVYLLPDAVVVWCGPTAVRIPRRLITEVHFRPLGLLGARACQVSWRNSPSDPSRTMHIGRDFGRFTVRDIERFSDWLYTTGQSRGRDPFT